MGRTGLALRGYDPVAYLTQGRPVPEKREFTAEHAGATYLFTSSGHRDAFKREPGRYVPEYGGYCAYGTVLGKKLDGDPEVWRIVDGKLYLNLNRDVQKLWSKDIPGYIEKAHANWPHIKDQPANALRAALARPLRPAHVYAVMGSATACQHSGALGKQVIQFPIERRPASGAIEATLQSEGDRP